MYTIHTQYTQGIHTIHTQYGQTGHSVQNTHNTHCTNTPKRGCVQTRQNGSVYNVHFRDTPIWAP
jgi:hypothetical protein